MTNRPKAIGTAAETKVKRWLQANGYPDADRLTQTGNHDRADVRACPGLVLEVKAGKKAQNPGPALLAAWWDQAVTEGRNNPDVVLPRRGRPGETVSFPTQCLLLLQRAGTTDVSRWWVVTPGHHQGYVWRELGDVLPDLQPAHVRPRPATP